MPSKETIPEEAYRTERPENPSAPDGNFNEGGDPNAGMSRRGFVRWLGATIAAAGGFFGGEVVGREAGKRERQQLKEQLGKCEEALSGLESEKISQQASCAAQKTVEGFFEEEIRRLQEEIQNLKKENDALKKENNALRVENERKEEEAQGYLKALAEVQVTAAFRQLKIKEALGKLAILGELSLTSGLEDLVEGLREGINPRLEILKNFIIPLKEQAEVLEKIFSPFISLGDGILKSFVNLNASIDKNIAGKITDTVRYFREMLPPDSKTRDFLLKIETFFAEAEAKFEAMKYLTSRDDYRPFSDVVSDIVSLIGKIDDGLTKVPGTIIELVRSAIDGFLSGKKVLLDSRIEELGEVLSSDGNIPPSKLELITAELIARTKKEGPLSAEEVEKVIEEELSK